MRKKYIADGFLVVGRIGIQGCVSYTHEDHNERVTDETLDAEWRGSKHVENVTEQRQVYRTRSLLQQQLGRISTYIDGVGFLVPTSLQTELEKALENIEIGIRDYNNSARVTRLNANFIVFTAAGDNERVARALYKKIVELLNESNSAIVNGDVKKLRAVLSQLKNVNRTLPKNAGDQITEMVNKMREAAKEAVKKVKDSELKDDKAIAKLTAKTLKGAKVVDGIRADLVECLESIEVAASKRKAVPTVDVREIE